MIHVHEAAYRGQALLNRLAIARLVVCGAGSLGANLTECLARTGARSLFVVDRDRVESPNLVTQPYGRDDLGRCKAESLAGLVFRNLGFELKHRHATVERGTVGRLLRGAELVIDCLDNRAGRLCLQEHCRAAGVPLLHAGVNGDFAEVVWDELYTVPSGAGEDVCDYPLARNLVSLTVACLAETVLGWLAEEARRSWTLTLADLAIRPYS